MPHAFAAALCLVLVLEGLFLFAAPRAWQQMAEQMRQLDPRAQTTQPVDTLAEARRLRDTKDFAGAAALLRPYVESHPDDAGSARFAALMAYWANDRVTADSLYAQALARHPGDANVRLEYGRFLIETGSSRRALV